MIQLNYQVWIKQFDSKENRMTKKKKTLHFFYVQHFITTSAHEQHVSFEIAFEMKNQRAAKNSEHGHT